MKYYRVNIKGSNYESTFSIKYSLTSSKSTYTLANLIYSSPPTASSGLTYLEMTSRGGVEVEVPDGIWKLKIEDEAGFCNEITSSALNVSVSGSGTNTYYLSAGFLNRGGNCGTSYLVNNAVSSNAGTIALGLASTVYDNGAIFQGGDLYYIVNTSTTTNPGSGSSPFYYWKIDDDGVIQDVTLWNCSGSFYGGYGGSF